MKKGISVWAFKKQPLKDVFALAKKAGYDGVELSLNEKGEVSLDSTKEDMEVVKALAKEAGIELYSVATGLYWSCFLTSAKEEVREKAKSIIIRKQIDVASWLGCDTILVVPGAVAADFVPNCEITDYDVAIDRAREGLKEVAAYAEEKKVAIGIENVGNKMLLSPLEMRDFIDSIGSDYVGAYFDVGNVMRFGYPEQWIKILGNRVKKVHFKDFKRSQGVAVPLMEGDVNYPAVMDALEKIGYDDWVTPETSPLCTYRPEMILYTTSIALDAIIAKDFKDK